MGNLSWLTARPIAHRGLHDAAKGRVENSPGALAAAMEAGYAIELDVQLTGDGDAVVFHDETLERLTGETGAVADRPCAEICRIRYTGSNDTIASLAQALEMIGGRVPLVIEIKSRWGKVGPLEKRVADLLRDYAGPVAVMSFDPESVAEIRRVAPGLVRGIVACDYRSLEDWPGFGMLRRFCMRHLLHAFTTRPHFISYDADALPAPATRLARLIGLPVITWTVRSEQERQRALRWCDQVTFEDFLA